MTFKRIPFSNIANFIFNPLHHTYIVSSTTLVYTTAFKTENFYKHSHIITIKHHTPLRRVRCFKHRIELLCGIYEIKFDFSRRINEIIVLFEWIDTLKGFSVVERISSLALTLRVYCVFVISNNRIEADVSS